MRQRIFIRVVGYNDVIYRRARSWQGAISIMSCHFVCFFDVKSWTAKHSFFAVATFFKYKDSIVATQGLSLIHIFSINDKIQTYCREWLYQLDRMEDERLTKVAFQYRNFSTKDAGRPRVRWRGTL